MFNYQSFRTGPICFGHFQIIKTNPEKSNLNLDKMIWTQPKLFGPDQNDLKPTKMICTCPKQFGRSKIILDIQKDRAYCPSYGQYCVVSEATKKNENFVTKQIALFSLQYMMLTYMKFEQ